MGDDNKPKLTVVMDSGASNMRALSGVTGSAEVKDKVKTPPDLLGPHGRAWLCDLDRGRRKLKFKREDDAGLCHWVIEAPWAHPVWHSYSLLLVHLRPMADARPTKFYFEGATHEFWLYALSPEIPRQPLISTGIVKDQWLSPMNFGAQIAQDDDEQAMARIRDTVLDIVEAKLSPDTDYFSEWQRRFGSAMIRKEFR